MTANHTRGETHGCIVCAKLYELYVVYDTNGRFTGLKVMSAGGRAVADARRPLVACERHSEEEIERAVERVYGKYTEEDE